MIVSSVFKHKRDLCEPAGPAIRANTCHIWKQQIRFLLSLKEKRFKKGEHSFKGSDVDRKFSYGKLDVQLSGNNHVQLFYICIT